MLGFISADGGRDRNWGIKIALHPKDSLILYEFAKRLHCNFEPRLVENGTRILLGLYDIDMVKDLEKYGIVERKTKTLEFAKNVPDKWLRHYLRGVFDGDGSVGRGKQATKLVTGSTPFYTGFMTWYKKTYGFEPWSKKEDDKYRLSFNHGKDSEFVNWMYKNATIGIDRKRKLFEMYWLSNDMVRTTGKPVESCIPVQDATK